MANNNSATATTYRQETATGHHIRRATRVTFADGYKVDFTELMPKGSAIRQAIEFRERKAVRARG